MSAPKEERYYLDTSAQIERYCGPSETRRTLKALLATAGFATSTQVEREWNRIVYGTCVAMRRALQGAEDYTDIVRSLSKTFGRGPARHWQISNVITEGETADLDLVSARLEDFQRIRSRAMWRSGRRELRDGTKCGVARHRPRLEGGRWQYRGTCRKIENICDQPAFLAANGERARQAATALLTAERPNDVKMGKKALEALDRESPEATKGAACHGSSGIGGDICIALECAEDEILLTTDASFDLICPALGLKHERLVA